MTACNLAIPGVGVQSVGLDDSMKLYNGDVSFVDALIDLRESINRGEEFTYPNTGLLLDAVLCGRQAGV